MEADLEAKFEAFLEDPGVSDRDLADLARAAQMLGMETLGSDGLSPSDLLSALGASS
jgi:hypothetical protein